MIKWVCHILIDGLPFWWYQTVLVRKQKSTKSVHANERGTLLLNAGDWCLHEHTQTVNETINWLFINLLTLSKKLSELLFGHDRNQWWSVRLCCWVFQFVLNILIKNIVYYEITVLQSQKLYKLVISYTYSCVNRVLLHHSHCSIIFCLVFIV
jgi:hypothetical protein